MIRRLVLALYYGFAQYFPTQPMPDWRLGYALRRALVQRLFKSCGAGVIVKRGVYFGDGSSLVVGNRAQIGANCRIDHDATIGDDVVMGPDVVIMTVGHAFADSTRPINQQGGLPRCRATIGRDVWRGTSVVILPGIEIADGAVIGAYSVVTKSIPSFANALSDFSKVFNWRGAAYQFQANISTGALN